MAISRPFLLALLGAALLGATFFAVQNAREGAAGDTAPVLPAQPADAPADQARASAPENTIANAFNGDLRSARFSGSLTAGAAGQSGTLTVNGAFEKPAKGEVAKFEVFVKASAPGANVDAGFVSTGDRGWFTQGDRAYRVPASVWDQVVQAAARAQTPAQQLKLPFAFNPQNWLRDVKQEDGETIDGVPTTHVSARLDAGSMFSDVMAAAQQAGASTAKLPHGLRRQLADAVKRAEFDLYAGKDDAILRRARADLEVATPDSGRVELSAELSLSDVNEPQSIAAPKNVVAGAPGGAAGAFAQSFLGAVGATEAAKAPSLAALATNNPQKAARAVRAHKKVVILFRNPRGIDDRLVSQALRAVDRDTKAVVLTDHVDAVERYGRLVEELGVSQTPSVVIIDRAGDAHLIEGYVDSEALIQAVADAR